MGVELKAIIAIGALVITIFSGVPIAFAMGICALVLSVIFGGGAATLPALFHVGYSSTSDFLLVCIPLFVFMSELLAKSEITKDLYDAMSVWLRWLPGGLAISSVSACTLFGAVTGSSVACTAAIGSIAIPEMRSRGYKNRLVTGSIAAGGGLGVLIPPSIPMILYGHVTQTSVGKLFMAGLMPGILLWTIYFAFIVIRTSIYPEIAPKIEERVTWNMRFRLLRRVFPIFVIIVAVMGVIYTGICTPTEAAAVGAFASLIVVLAHRRLTLKVLRESLIGTLRTTAMVLMIIMGALTYGYVITREGIVAWMTEQVLALGLQPIMILIMINVLLIFLGCILEVVSIILITMPLLTPILLGLNFDLIWFGAVMVVNMEMALITPPVGLNLYVVRGIANDLPFSEIIKGASPFMILQAVGLALVIIFPQIAIFLPSHMFR
jgi:C4-dicarboxylate transporter DctM subunit